MPTQTNEFELERARLMNLLASSGIHHPVLSALATVPRHLFVDQNLWATAYEDQALPIGEGQTISQPSLVAQMLQVLELKGREKALEIGTGSGWQAALLSKLVRQVYSIERIASLASLARQRISKLAIKNVAIVEGDGTRGLPKFAPFDAIIVTAYAQRVPPALVRQLAEGGKLLIPLGQEDWQEVMLYQKVGGKLDEGRKVAPVLFVPLITNEKMR